MTEHPAIGLEYNAACVFSLAAQAVAKDANLPDARRNELSEKYKVRAVELLQVFSKIGGFKNPSMQRNVKSDSDLDAIRDTAEFKQLISDF